MTPLDTDSQEGLTMRLLTWKPHAKTSDACLWTLSTPKTEGVEETFRTTVPLLSMQSPANISALYRTVHPMFFSISHSHSRLWTT